MGWETLQSLFPPIAELRAPGGDRDTAGRQRARQVRPDDGDGVPPRGHQAAPRQGLIV